MQSTVIVNFKGGIISPGELLEITQACEALGIGQVRFGLRQQLFITTENSKAVRLLGLLEEIGPTCARDIDHLPNVISSYPAEEIFIRNKWLTEGVYKDIFDSIDFPLRLKVNICDNNQSFTPLLTGNLNWIASASPHYWNLIVRFPKTNICYEWDMQCYTNDIPVVTRHLDELVFAHPKYFTDTPDASGDALFAMLKTENFIVRKAESAVTLPHFNLPYYEGINRYNDKYWVGIYRRDELFPVSFLKSLSKLCLDTRLGQIGCTSWKSLLIKGIEEKDKPRWNLLLEEFNINMRHAANELNFQVEDNCQEGVQLKKYLVEKLHQNDIRTFGICIGIKTRRKSEVFSSILIRQRHLIVIGNLRFLKVFDLLCARNFNPNQRTDHIFAKSIPKFRLPGRLAKAIARYYAFRTTEDKAEKADTGMAAPEIAPEDQTGLSFQCRSCLTVYTESAGEPENGIAPGTAFDQLPEDYCCPLCEESRYNFKEVTFYNSQFTES